MDNLFNNIKTYSNFDKCVNSQKIGIFVVKNQTYQPPTYIRLLSVFNHLNSQYDACLIDVKDESEINIKSFQEICNSMKLVCGEKYNDVIDIIKE